MVNDWSAKTDWMREVGAVEATFSESGALLFVKLAPAVPPADDTDAPKRETPQEAQKRLEEDRRRLIFGAAGGLVKRRDPSQ